jgi:hypothetical protein
MMWFEVLAPKRTNFLVCVSAHPSDDVFNPKKTIVQRCCHSSDSQCLKKNLAARRAAQGDYKSPLSAPLGIHAIKP